MVQLELTEQEKREAIIAHCLKLNSCGLNHGASGNISIRHGDGFLISPTSTPYHLLTPEMISSVNMDGDAEGPIAPSSEWRIHRDIYARRPDIHSVVHAHPTYSTVLAIHGKEIKAIHYMIAIFGGSNVRVAPYAIYGSQELADHAVTALEDRTGCLLAHHGSITIGSSLEEAFWRMEELETLAERYHNALALGEPPLLSDSQVKDVIDKISGYGLSEGEG